MAALLVAIVSFAAFALAAGLDWPGAANHCTTGAGCFCERIRPGAIAQPANTWSCLGFIAVGLWIAWDSARRRTRDDSGNRFARATAHYAPLYASVVVFLGPGAMYFHGGMVHWGGRLDVLSMYLFIGFLVVYLPVRTYDLSWRSFTVGYGLLMGVLTLDVYVRDGDSVPVFAPLVALVCVFEIVAAIPVARLRLGRPGDVVADRRWILAAAGCFFTALGIWLVSDTGGPLCDPDSLLQGHAAWHLLSAAAAACIYLYFRSESPPRPLRSSV